MSVPSNNMSVRYYQNAIALSNVAVCLLGRTGGEEKRNTIATESMKTAIDAIKRMEDASNRSFLLKDVEFLEKKYKEATAYLANKEGKSGACAAISRPEPISLTNPNVDLMKHFFVDDYKTSLHSMNERNPDSITLKALLIQDASDLMGNSPHEIEFVSSVMCHNLGISYIADSLHTTVSSSSSSKNDMSMKLLKVGSRLLELSLQLVEDQIMRHDAYLRGEIDLANSSNNNTSDANVAFQLLSLFTHRFHTLSSLRWVGLRLYQQEKRVLVDELDAATSEVLGSIENMLDSCTKSIYETFSLVKDLFRDPQFIVTTSAASTSSKNVKIAAAA